MVVVFGSINVDFTARVAALPRRGETITGRDLQVSPGGKGANQALAARRAGADVALAGATGRDAFAETALALLRVDGVDLAHVRAVDAATGVALIHVDAAGDNAITVVPGANALARADQVSDALLARAALLVLQLETPADQSLDVARRAGALGKRVMLNAAPAAPLDAAWREVLDVLVVNAVEAQTLAPSFGAPGEPVAFAAFVSGAYDIDVIVTLGGDGACALSRGIAHRVPALGVDVVDTVGAGDAFAGALAAALDRGETLRRALACASAAGALACTRAGAQAALPRADEIARHAASLDSVIVTERLPS